MSLGDELARIANILQRDEVPRYRVVLGSEFSGFTSDVLERIVLEQEYPAAAIERMDQRNRKVSFDDAWVRMGNDRRITCVEQSWATSASDGDDALAWMLANRYLNVVFTTDIGTSLEDALHRHNVSTRDINVMHQGAVAADTIKASLARRKPRIKLIKLYGGLSSGTFAVSVRERRDYARQVKSFLASELAADALLIGCLDSDEAILHSLHVENKRLICVNRELPPQAIAYDVARTQQLHMAPAEFFVELKQRLCATGGQSGSDERQHVRPSPQVGASSKSTPTVRSGAVPVMDEDSERERQPLVVSVGPLVDTSPVVVASTPTVLRIEYDGQQLSFEMSGANLSFQSQRVQLKLAPLVQLNGILQILGKQIRDALMASDDEARSQWRLQARFEGTRLYSDIFRSDSQLPFYFGQAVQSTERESLYLCFAGPRSHLGMPYELLYADGEVNESLVLRYPLFREVTGVPSRAGFSDILERLQRDNECLRVLLIAANSDGTLSAEDEVMAIQQIMERVSTDTGVRLDITVLTGDTASSGRVNQLLNKCQYHIVHYAGHAAFDSNTGESSHLALLDGRRRKVELSASALHMHLHNSQTTLMFLSACVGAAVGSEELLAQRDNLGLMDAVVTAGVPVVLGYRWHVLDESARFFAVEFYEYLLRTHQPAVAVHHARQAIHRREPDDETWTSPILVMQNG